MEKSWNFVSQLQWEPWTTLPARDFALQLPWALLLVCTYLHTVYRTVPNWRGSCVSSDPGVAGMWHVQGRERAADGGCQRSEAGSLSSSHTDSPWDTSRGGFTFVIVKLLAVFEAALVLSGHCCDFNCSEQRRAPPSGHDHEQRGVCLETSRRVTKMDTDFFPNVRSLLDVPLFLHYKNTKFCCHLCCNVHVCWCVCGHKFLNFFALLSLEPFLQCGGQNGSTSGDMAQSSFVFENGRWWC